MHRTTASQTVEIAGRFCGPPGVGNGGMVCALLAEHCGSSLDVTLRLPAPLDRPLAVRPGATEDHHALVDGDRVIADGRAASLSLDVPTAPTWDDAHAALRASDPSAHPFPDCFVCGPARGEGDGLRAISGPVRGRRGLVAAPWRPHACFADADADGVVQERFLWAALDCPGGLAALGGRSVPIVLGRLTGHVERSVRANERCVVFGWTIERRGRKHVVGTALVDEAGVVCGRACATWVELGEAHASAA